MTPEIACGRYPAKRCAGDKVIVEADIFIDGHDSLAASIQFRKNTEDAWQESPMEFLDNDRWQGSFNVDTPGYYTYTITAWIDRFASWQSDLKKRVDAGQQDLDLNLQIGSNLVVEASQRASETDMKKILGWGWSLESSAIPVTERIDLAMNKELTELMKKYSDKYILKRRS